jgi:tRNA-dihydrouridine synthase
MEDVTDTVFRRIVTKCGRPELFFTEFTSVEGMFSPGGNEVRMRLEYTQEEKPLFAQIWGINPDNYRKGAEELVKMGFNGIDLNFGCPVRKIVKQGACSALIRNKPLAAEIISAVREGADGLPVSVKTRIGFDRIETEEWIGFLLEQKPDMLTVHGRIAVEMSTKPNNWEELSKIKGLRDRISPTTLIVANGDIKSLEQGEQVHRDYGFDGFMIGRGIFENPWVFNKDIKEEDISLDMRISLLREHLDLFIKTWGNRKNFSIMKKFFKIYIKGFPGASEFRARLMECRTADEVYSLLDHSDIL